MSAETGSLTLRPSDTHVTLGPDLAELQSTWSGLLAAPAGIFLATRAFLALLVWNSPHLLPSPHIGANASVLPARDVLFRGGAWTQPWFRFDTRWYVGVAEHGYHWGVPSQSNTNFLPVYPILIGLGKFLVDDSPWVAAWLISNLAFLVALALLWEWSRRKFPGDTARRILVLTSIFPFSFFYATPYAESLFLAMAVSAFLLAENGHWPAAIAVAAFSTLTRPVGLAVLLGLAVLALSRADRRRAAMVTLGALPLLGFAAFLGLAFRRPFAFLVSHSGGWVRPHGSLVATIASQFHTYLTPFDRIDAFLALTFLVSGVAAWRRLGPAYGAYVLSGVMLPLAHGLVGMERYVIVLFPVFAVWASVKNRALQIALFGISLAGLIGATTMYATGYTLI